MWWVRFLLSCAGIGFRVKEKRSNPPTAYTRNVRTQSTMNMIKYFDLPFRVFFYFIIIVYVSGCEEKESENKLKRFGFLYKDVNVSYEYITENEIDCVFCYKNKKLISEAYMDGEGYVYIRKFRIENRESTLQKFDTLRSLYIYEKFLDKYNNLKTGVYLDDSFQDSDSILYNIIIYNNKGGEINSLTKKFDKNLWNNRIKKM